MNFTAEKQLVNRILTVLNEHSSKGGMGWMETTFLRNKLGIDQAGHASLRQLLGKLSNRKMVKRQGYGKFRWKINVKTWMSDNPYTAIGGDSVNVPKNLIDPSYVPKKESAAYDPNAVQPENDDDETPVPQIKSVVEYDDSSIRDEFTKLKQYVSHLKETVDRSCKVLEVKKYDGESVKLKNVVLPKTFEEVKELVRCRRPVLLVGPAGCGKTHMAELMSKVLKFPRFGSISCTAGMSEAHILGRAVPDLTHGKNRFQGTDFLKCYEEGGLFLFDEFDAADPNLLLAVNSALANEYCNVPNRPDKPRASQHKDFACVATANTFGRGATRMYAGRNQLDEATLDRFRIGFVEVDYDEVIERSLCPDDTLRSTLQVIRQQVHAAGLRRVVSTRFMRDAYVMMTQAKWTVDKITNVLMAGWTEDEKVKITGVAAKSQS